MISSFLALTVPSAPPDLGDRIEDALAGAVARSIIDALPDDSLDAFEAVLEQGGEADIRSFLREHAPQARSLVGATIAEARETAACVLSPFSAP